MAPLASMLVLASASEVVSVGPVVQVPLAMFKIQFTSLVYDL
jgi:hypothetical protein